MGSKARILVVDDNRSLVRVIEGVLQRQGYEVLTAYDGAEGFEKAKKEKPDLIIGSSFERAAYPPASFVGITPPLRGRVLLRSRALAGIEGSLSFMEEVLNACMDRNRRMAG